MTAILSDELVEWLSPEDVARLTGRADVGDSLLLGYLKSVQPAPWTFMVRRDWVDEWVKEYG